MAGWIKLHRSLIEWQWYSDINTTRLWVHLLITANHEDKKWMGIIIERGQKATSLDSLSVETGLSIMQVRTSLNKLKKSEDITIKTTNKFTIVSINKYKEYQVKQQTNNKQITNEQQTNNKQITTTKEEKKRRREELNTTTLVVGETGEIEKKVYGNEDINIVINQLIGKLGIKQLDGSKQENRRYAHNMIRKYGSVGEVIALINEINIDQYNKISSFKDLYYKGEKARLQINKAATIQPSSMRTNQPFTAGGLLSGSS